MRTGAVVLAALGLASAVAAGQEPEIPAFARNPPPVRSADPILRFNGRDLAGFYAFTRTHGFEDPQRVFSVQDGMLRVSGEDFAGLATGGVFADYHLVVEWRWGEKTWGKRTDAARDSGILLHGVGRDGAAHGQWLESVECQLIEGGCGDFILVDGKGRPRMTSPTRTGPDKQPYYDPAGPAAERDRGRINWWGRDPGWKDVRDTRDRTGVERPRGEWNRTEVICDGDAITVLMNGVLVNRGTKVQPAEGKIQFQSEGAELFFRTIEVRPLVRDTPPKAPAANP